MAIKHQRDPHWEFPSKKNPGLKLTKKTSIIVELRVQFLVKWWQGKYDCDGFGSKAPLIRKGEHFSKGVYCDYKFRIRDIQSKNPKKLMCFDVILLPTWKAMNGGKCHRPTNTQQHYQKSQGLSNHHNHNKTTPCFQWNKHTTTSTNRRSIGNTIIFCCSQTTTAFFIQVTRLVWCQNFKYHLTCPSPKYKCKVARPENE